MSLSLPILCLLLAESPTIETRFVQVATAQMRQPWWNTPNKGRAVVLIHGLLVHPFSQTNVARAQPHSWQKPNCPLVKRLSADADVFAFSYGQTATADEVAECPQLQRHLRKLCQDGYREIVLIGHSAGGVIARQFVEDHPNSGVTKVIQVCAPNAGSGWAAWKTVRANQADFLSSLSKPARRRTLSDRADKRIPANVEFACVVCTAGVGGDGLVATRSQYTPELRQQRIAVYPFASTHWMVLRGPKGVELVARLVGEPQPRWDAQRVTEACKRLALDRSKSTRGHDPLLGPP